MSEKEFTEEEGRLDREHSGKELADAFAALPTPSTPQGTALRTALSTIPRTLSAAQARCKQDEASEHELPKVTRVGRYFSAINLRKRKLFSSCSCGKKEKAFLCNVDRSILLRCDETCAAALKQKKEEAQHQRCDAHLVEKAATNTSVVREPMCRRNHYTRVLFEQGGNSMTYKYLVDEAPIVTLSTNSEFRITFT
jgi:hypothetical protein